MSSLRGRRLLTNKEVNLFDSGQEIEMMHLILSLKTINE